MIHRIFISKTNEWTLCNFLLFHKLGLLGARNILMLTLEEGIPKGILFSQIILLDYIISSWVTSQNLRLVAQRILSKRKEKKGENLVGGCLVRAVPRFVFHLGDKCIFGFFLNSQIMFLNKIIL